MECHCQYLVLRTPYFVRKQLFFTPADKAFVARGFTITARTLISDPSLFLQSIELGTIAGVEGGEAMMAAVAEAYRQKMGHDDSLLRMMARFHRAMTAQDQAAMATSGAGVVQAFADKEVVLRGLLSQIRRRKEVNLKDPLHRLRVDLAAKLGTLYLRGARPKATSLIQEYTFPAYWIEPLAEPDSQKWFGMLQASLFGALERSYAGHPEIFTGRDCLDRAMAWNLFLELYRSNEKKAKPGEPVHFYPFRKKWPAAAVVSVSGGVQRSFNEYSVGPMLREATIEITSDDLRKAKRKAHDFLRANPALQRQRVRWLGAVKAYEEEAKSRYLSGLAKAFHFQSRLSELPGSELHRNPDLFLLHQFLKEIVWRRFWKLILTFATPADSGR